MPISIKRYQNRKLYNTETKEYITLEQVRELICSGVDIVVNDTVSGEDITTYILAQVIMGLEKKRRSTSSTGLLMGLIRAGGDTLSLVSYLLPNLPKGVDISNVLNIPTKKDITKLADQIEELRLAIDEIAVRDKTNGRD